MRRTVLRVVVMAVVLAAVASPVADAARPAIAVRPAVGGQGTSFAIGYRATSVFDDGADADGSQNLVLYGPPGTPCEGDTNLEQGSAFQLGGNSLFFEGPAVFRIGVRLPRGKQRENAAAFRLVRAWCPGRYRGEIREDYPIPATTSRDVGTFSFRVRRTRRTKGALSPFPPFELKRLGADDTRFPGYRVRPRRGRARTQFEVSFPVARAGNVEVDVVPPSRRCAERVYVPVRFPRGRATIAFSSRLPTGRRSRHRHAFHTGSRTCAGTWSVFLQNSGEVGLSFKVVP